jgi:hypothetical protein
VNPTIKGALVGAAVGVGAFIVLTAEEAAREAEKQREAQAQAEAKKAKEEAEKQKQKEQEQAKQIAALEAANEYHMRQRDALRRGGSDRNVAPSTISDPTAYRG